MATITKTVSDIVTKTVAFATASSTMRATPQGGILEGSNPSVYDAKNPIYVFIIQAGIIIIFCRLLHWPLHFLRQPRVIAEVIGGILLGPSVMGHIPGFSNAIFPAASLPNLNLVANLGLLLFLFLVGLEVDLRYFASNWKIALSVGAAGMAIPFALGSAIAWGLYNQFKDEPNTVPINFGTYMLFVGVALAITAFPVLARILTEQKLLSTPVGVIVLSAGVGNDVVGWILLALTVALTNAGKGLTALWILLTAVGYCLFLIFAVRPAFLSILRRTRSLQDGPSQSIVTLTLFMALASAFFTGAIGVHPIFGAFMVGLICPHEGGFAIKVTEKVEDLVSAVFLPLYFALSGLSTNLGLLDNGITWAYVVGVTAVAFFGKIAGGTIAAKLNGRVWRESLTIGVLMSCKGLVELIVLNIGLQAKILNTRTCTLPFIFAIALAVALLTPSQVTIFVVMALVTTFATAPLTAALYPPWYQRKLEAWKRGEIDWETGKATHDGASEIDTIAALKVESAKIRRLLVYLRLDSMPTLLAFMSLFGEKPGDLAKRKHPALSNSPGDENVAPLAEKRRRSMEIHGVRLLELTERGSAVMKVTEIDEYSIFDPVLNAFRVLGQLYNLAVSGEVAVVPESSFADTLTAKVMEEPSDLLLLPWSETGSLSESQTISSDSVQNKLASDDYRSFISKALDTTQCNTAVFINKGFSGSLPQRPSTLKRSMSALSLRSHRDQGGMMPNMDRSHHIFMPFYGGADGRVALRLVLQLAENAEVTATIVHYEITNPDAPVRAGSVVAAGESTVITSQDGSKPRARTIHASRESDTAFFATMHKSISPDLQTRVVLETATSSTPIEDSLAKAQMEVAQSPRNGGDLIVVGRHLDLFGKGSGGCLGLAAQSITNSGVKASLLVVQARGEGHEY